MADILIPATMKVVVKEIKGDHFPDVGSLKRHGKFYVKLILGGEVKQTTVTSRGKALVWNENFYFEANDSSSLELQVFAQRTIGSDDCIGGINESVTSLVAQGTVTRKLNKHDSKGGMHGLQATIEFTIIADSTGTSIGTVESQMGEAVEQANDASKQMKSIPQPLENAGGAVERSDSTIQQFSDLADAWEPLIEKVKLFTTIVDDLAEIHPYAKMAWSVLSVTYKIILAQKDRDESVGHLVEIMNDAYAFVHEAEAVKRIESQKQIVARLAQQTTECAYFIRDYAKNKNFWARTFRNIATGIDDKIQQYGDKFETLKLAFQGRATLQTEITVLRTLDIVENLVLQVDLNDMLYAKGAGYNPEKECLPKTRVAVIDEIIDWANRPDGDDVPRLFWLCGAAGSGKSSIAHSVARIFDEQKRLGSSFCFDRSNQADRRPNYVFSTIAVDLADLDAQWRHSLWNVVKDNRSLRTTASIQRQFDHFMLKPAESLKVIGPIIIVIDALDECGDRTSRKALLATLAGQMSNLPPNFRILLTSRPEPDIQHAFDSNPNVFCKQMHSIDPKSTTDDIFLFVQTQLSDIPSLKSVQWYDLLAQQSEGLFQWAFTACEAIQDPTGGLTAQEQLLLFISSASCDSGQTPLYQLYSVILGQAFDSNDAVLMTQFQSVMGRVLAAKEPLPISALNVLCADNESNNMAELILQPLGSLLSGVTQQSVPVCPQHASFHDFLTNADYSGSFYVDVSLQNQNLAMASLQVMKTGLKFNICGLESSYISNKDVPNLSQCIENAIPAHLAYACRFWADHLQDSQGSKGLQIGVQDFIYNQFLFWLEVLSLITSISLASPALLKAATWCKENDTDPDLEAFFADANNFVTTFKDPIMQCAPHIYLSALPFSPLKSLVSKQFQPQYLHTLAIQTGRAEKWPVLLYALQGHTGGVRSVRFSPDSKLIVSGSEDKTIRVWDVETGSTVSGPFIGHTGGVKSVMFSPDGKHIVSGSDDQTIRIWGAETGVTVSGPFFGHTHWVWSVLFSQDSKYVISGSRDETIQVWDVETGKTVSTFKGHSGPVRSVMFSPDYKYIVSGSVDKTVRIWDAITGETVSGPFEGHLKPVYSVAFSPDGKQLVSGSHDTAIVVWGVDAGRVNNVAGPFAGHTGSVMSVMFSPDSKYIVSGSYDSTVRVWDAKTHQCMSGPLRGHTNAVWSTAFSPDGRYIVSGAEDHDVLVWNTEMAKTGMSEPLTGSAACVMSVAFSPDGKHIVSGTQHTAIQVWDVETGNVVSKPSSFRGHTGAVRSVMFSPDGKHIVSCSMDMTIRIWDAETGKAVLEPIKGHNNTILSVAFSPDGKQIVSGSHDGTIAVWDAETGHKISGHLKGRTGSVRSVAFSPDGMHVASGSEDKTVLVWDVKTGDTVPKPFIGHTALVRSVAYSPDGKHIVSGSYDKTILVWDAETGNPVTKPFIGHTGNILSVAFSPDGKYIVSGGDDEIIRVWDPETGDIALGPFVGHTAPVWSVAFSPDCKCIVSGSEDKTIRFWGVQSGAMVLPVAGKSVAFSSDLNHALPSNDNLFSPVTDVGPGNHINIRDGWVVGPQSQLLFWVPPQHRPGLWWPRNTLVIGNHVTMLDLSRFAYGSLWQQCRT